MRNNHVGVNHDLYSEPMSIRLARLIIDGTPHVCKLDPLTC